MKSNESKHLGNNHSIILKSMNELRRRIGEEFQLRIIGGSQCRQMAENKVNALGHLETRTSNVATAESLYRQE